MYSARCFVTSTDEASHSAGETLQLKNVLVAGEKVNLTRMYVSTQSVSLKQNFKLLLHFERYRPRISAVTAS